MHSKLLKTNIVTDRIAKDSIDVEKMLKNISSNYDKMRLLVAKLHNKKGVYSDLDKDDLIKELGEIYNSNVELENRFDIITENEIYLEEIYNKTFKDLTNATSGCEPHLNNLLNGYPFNFEDIKMPDYFAIKNIEMQFKNSVYSYIDDIMNGNRQDNIGKILMSMISFRRLKRENPTDYKGGLFLIDELDATLHPSAKIQLLKVLNQFAKDTNVQVIFTTHSLTLLRMVGDSTSTAAQTALNNKVDKVTGKQLSTEDYTSAEKTKLAGIQEGARVNTVTSVAGRTGAVTLTKGDVGLVNVDNTADSAKNVLSATKLTTARTITIQINGTTIGSGSFDGSGNLTINLSSIAATNISITSSTYLGSNTTLQGALAYIANVFAGTQTVTKLKCPFNLSAIQSKKLE